MRKAISRLITVMQQRKHVAQPVLEDLGVALLGHLYTLAPDTFEQQVVALTRADMRYIVHVLKLSFPTLEARLNELLPPAVTLIPAPRTRSHRCSRSSSRPRSAASSRAGSTRRATVDADARERDHSPTSPEAVPRGEAVMLGPARPTSAQKQGQKSGGTTGAPQAEVWREGVGEVTGPTRVLIPKAAAASRGIPLPHFGTIPIVLFSLTDPIQYIILMTCNLMFVMYTGRGVLHTHLRVAPKDVVTTSRAPGPACVAFIAPVSTTSSTGHKTCAATGEQKNQNVGATDVRQVLQNTT